MVTRAQKFRLGIFVSISSLFLIILLGIVTGKKLMETKDYYYIVYKDVSVDGLELGADVKYHGIRIGKIEDINFDAQDITKVVVTISVNEGTVIKDDVQGVVSAVGITGLKIVELVGGTNESPVLEPGGTIQPGESVLTKITGKAEVITEKIEIVLNNLVDITGGESKAKLKATISNLNEVLADIHSILSGNEQEIANTLSNVSEVSKELISVTKKADSFVGRLDSLAAGSDTREILANLNEFSNELSSMELKETIASTQEAINNINAFISQMDFVFEEGREDIIRSVELLKETMQYLNEFSREISENPSVLIRERDVNDYYDGE